MIERATIGVIGGSGVYGMAGVEDVREISLDTPYGSASDALLLGNVEGVPVAFLPRHGRGHRFTPTEIPYRANIHALRQLGVQRALSVSAVGSLCLEYAPGDFVMVDQFIDRTYRREQTFFAQRCALQLEKLRKILMSLFTRAELMFASKDHNSPLAPSRRYFGSGVQKLSA
jgi:purine nucleoside phosphorylase